MPKLPRISELFLQDPSKLHEKARRPQALLYLAKPFHDYLLKFFPRNAQGTHDRIKEPTQWAEEEYFKTTRPKNPEVNLRGRIFQEVLQERGIADFAVDLYYLSCYRSRFHTHGETVPLHTAALGYANDVLLRELQLPGAYAGQFRQETFSEKAQDYLSTYTDLDNLPTIMAENVATVSAVLDLLLFEAKSTSDALRIIAANLEPRPEPEAHGFNTFELLANTINGFWGGFPANNFLPRNILEPSGRASLQLIGAVHALIKRFPDSYHGGCPNRYTLNGEAHSAVTELVEIFVERYKEAIEVLKPFA